MSKKKISTLEELRAMTEVEIARQVGELTEEVIRKRVADQLNRVTNELVGKALGLNNRWGGWEVDNCNGRAGESALGDHLRANAKNAVAAWLGELNLNGIKPSKQMIDATKKEYVDLLDCKLRERACVLAEQEAAQILNDLLGKK